MATKEEIYNIRVGRHSLHQVSLGQLKMIQNLIHDFFTKEDWIPLAAAATNPNLLSPNMIFIAKDTCFDSRTRDFQTEYSVHIGKDALTNISAKDLINLYFTLRSFLFRSEELPTESTEDIQNQLIKDERKLLIEITDKAFDDYLIQAYKLPMQVAFQLVIIVFLNWKSPFVNNFRFDKWACASPCFCYNKGENKGSETVG